MIAHNQEIRVDLTAVTKIKHADLWRAAKRMGGQAALSRHLGVRATDLGCWINLTRCPPRGPNGKSWSLQRIAEFEEKLYKLTGKSLDELFPESLRESIGYKRRPLEIEVTASVSQLEMEKLSDNCNLRLLANNQECFEELTEEVLSAMKQISLESEAANRRMNAVRLSFGLDGYPMKLDELGTELGVCRERARQLLASGIRMLQSRMSRSKVAVNCILPGIPVGGRRKPLLLI